MRTQSRDTSPGVEAVQMQLFREAGIPGRWRMTMSMIRGVREMQRSALRTRHPEWCDEDITWAMVALNYGDELAARARHYVESYRTLG